MVAETIANVLNGWSITTSSNTFKSLTEQSFQNENNKNVSPKNN